MLPGIYLYFLQCLAFAVIICEIYIHGLIEILSLGFLRDWYNGVIHPIRIVMVKIKY